MPFRGPSFRRSGEGAPRNTLYNLVNPITIPFAATITLNLQNGLACNFLIGTLTANITLANPINARPGQTGVIKLVQDGSGSRTLTLGGNFKTAGGAPTLSTAINTVDFLSYWVETPTLIRLVLAKAFA
jgi:hypothetical protein